MKNSLNYAKGIVLPAAIFVVLMLCGTLATTYLVNEGWFGVENISYGAAITLVVSTLVSTWILIRQLPVNPIVASLISATGIVLLMLLLNLLFVEQGIRGFWVTAILVYSSGIAAFLVQNRPKKQKFLKYKNR